MNGHDGGIEGVTEPRERSGDFVAERMTGDWRGKTEGTTLNRARAGELGGKVLTYNPEMLGEDNGRQKRAHEQVPTGVGRETVGNFGGETEKEIAENVAYEEKLARENGDLAGEEGKTQAEVYLAEDYEDVANERGENGLYVKNLMDRNRKKITTETVAAMDKIINDNNYQPQKLERAMNNARIKFLGEVFDRVFGGRN